MLTIDFCLPAHNEEKILAQNLERLLAYLRSQNLPYAWQAIVILNGSIDNTLLIANKFAETNSELKVYNIKEAIKGKGNALKKYFSESSADIIAYMDVDLATDLKFINNLIAPLINKEADLVIGSRLLKASKTDRSLIREFISQIYSLLARTLLKSSIKDFQCGFKALTRETWRALMPLISDSLWSLDTELIVLAEKQGYRVKEIPIEWQDGRFVKRPSRINLLKASLELWTKVFELRRRLKKFQ